MAQEPRKSLQPWVMFTLQNNGHKWTHALHNSTRSVSTQISTVYYILGAVKPKTEKYKLQHYILTSTEK